ncbi:MAG: hypothetical protein KA469_00190 [Phycisphaerae bacterium]|jgi:hypothetical protein|nr:hypothetical protein [Phycisphaerae bacterium]
MADKADRGLGPLEGTFHVEQTPAVGARVSRKKDSSRRQREKRRQAGGIEKMREEKAEQTAEPDGHVDYRA